MSTGFHSRVEGIRDSCKDDPAMFESLMEEYNDEEYFSSDTGKQVDRLVAFAYTGTTAMKHSVPIGSRSGSESSRGGGGELQSPLVDLTGGSSGRGKKTPEKAVDLDKTIEMRDETLAAMDASEQETPRIWEGPERPISEALMKKKKKSKQA